MIKVPPGVDLMNHFGTLNFLNVSSNFVEWKKTNISHLTSVMK